MTGLVCESEKETRPQSPVIAIGARLFETGWKKSYMMPYVWLTRLAGIGVEDEVEPADPAE